MKKKVDDDGKIIEADFYFNELNGDFIDGYKIENGEITKRFIIKEEATVQKASFFSFFQENEFDCWVYSCSALSTVTVKAHRDMGFSIKVDMIGIYSVGGSGGGTSSGAGGGSGTGTSATSAAGTIYATRTCSDGVDCDNLRNCLQGYVKDSRGNCVFDDKIDTSKLEGKAKCIYQKMADNDNNINWILENFEDDDKPSEFNIKFEMSTTLGNETNASTVKSGNTFIIKINQNRAENINTTLTIARTILHEGIHARLREFASRQGSNETSFPGIYDYFRRFEKNWDHQQMANHYRNTIAQELKQYDNAQHSDAFYNALAWEGLAEIKDLNGNQATIYTEAWKELASSEQQEILNIISDEKQNGNKDCE